MITLDETTAIKKFLASYIYAMKRAEQIELEIMFTRQSQIMPSKGLDGMPHSFKKSDLSDYAVKLDDLLMDLRDQYDRILMQKKLVMALIEELTQENEKLVLWCRYISTDGRGNRLTWIQIGERVGYSSDHARKIRDRAVEHLAEVWPEYQAKYL